MLFASGNNLVKAGVLLMLFWGAWFRTGPQQKAAQLHTVATLIGCFVAMVVARILVLTLPLRARPLHEPGLDFTLPIGVDPGIMDGWSAFPSDHATLFYALAAGLFFIHRWLGMAAVLYVTVFIALPRIYLGYHYPSDIVAGALLGSLVVLACQQRRVMDNLVAPIWRRSVTHPSSFYPMFLLVTYQVADLFDNSRELLRFCKQFVEMLLA